MKKELIGCIVLSLFSLFAHGQVKSIEGKVSGEDENPIPGVTVVLKGTTIGATTDFDGHYQINLDGKGGVLVFSFIGFASQEIEIGQQSILNVILKEETKGIDEVVVVGYGTQKRTNVSSSVASVKMDEALGDRPLSSTAQVLQGTTPGLEVVTGNGRPGEGSSINVRGFTSINGGGPLILVDNAEVPSINDINPADIESVSVLKDAASAAIYGARGAFGVVLVTTKKGNKNQQPKLTYTSNVAFTYATNLPDKLNTYETAKAFQKWEIPSTQSVNDVDRWVELLEDYQVNPGNYPDGEYIDPTTGTRFPLMDGINWWDEAFTNGFEQIHNLSYIGGSENTSYRASLGYTNQDGIMITDKDSYKRYNLNLNLTTDITKHIKSFINVFYKNELRRRPNQYGTIFARGSYIGPFILEGYHTNPSTGEVLPYENPYNLLTLEPYVKDYGDDTRINGKVEWKPLKHFTFTADYTFNKTTNYNKRTTTASRFIDSQNGDLITLGSTTYFYKWNGTTDYQALNLLGQYENSFGGHNIKVLAGTNYEEAKQEAFNGRRDDLISVDLPGFNTATGDQTVGDGYYQWAVAGYLARINYNYKEKYLLEFTGRYDGSSRFAPDDRFVFLPSTSAGWVISNEGFMESVKPDISYLKVYGSAGVIGNQRVTSGGSQDYYPYLPTFPTYKAEWVDPSDVPYVTLGTPQLVSAGFTWEKVQTVNLGIEAGLFKDRLMTTFERYNRKVIGALDDAVELPGVLGTIAPKQNVVNTLTKGWDFNLTWRDNIGDDFFYSIGGNLFDSRAFITKIDNASGSIYGNYVGKELGELWGYETIGFYQVDDFEEGTAGEPFGIFTLKDGVAPFENTSHVPGDIRFADIDGDGEINDGLNTLEDHGDLKRIGNNRRRYQYGINASLEYKGFSASVFLQGVGKRNRNIFTYVTMPYSATYSSAVLEPHLDTWSPDDTDARWPRVASRNYFALTNLPQTRYLYDVSYLSVRNITLGYNFPKTLFGRIGLSALRLSVSGENLFTFDKLPDGVDSDQTIESAGFGYPYTKKYSLGLNISF